MEIVAAQSAAKGGWSSARAATGSTHSAYHGYGLGSASQTTMANQAAAEASRARSAAIPAVAATAQRASAIAAPAASACAGSSERRPGAPPSACREYCGW